MLRITTTREGEGTLVRLEGRLAGPWVAELRRWWETERAARGAGPTCVEMSDVAFISDDGKTLLEWMSREGVELRAHGCLTRAVRDDIVGCARRRANPRPGAG